VNISKKQFEFLAPSWAQSTALLGDSSFLKYILDFPKDSINDETIELLMPYMDMSEFSPKVAKAASLAAEGLCTWVRSMVFYTAASKIVRPKLEQLQVAEGQFNVAMAALHDAESRLAMVEAKVKELKVTFERQIAEKRRIEDNAHMLKRKMEQAANLIKALDGERERWSEDSAAFADVKRRLLGDCAVAVAFISYCGPFNAPFRHYLVSEKFTRAARKRNVPVTNDLDVTAFLADIGLIGDWNLQGLPTDPLSIQNGILVTRSSRYPLLVDPQGQVRVCRRQHLASSHSAISELLLHHR
jgi:dynein heavy chain, axonemal